MGFCTSTTPMPAEGRASTAEIAKKTMGFCTSTTPIPAVGRASRLEIAKKPWVFAPRPRRSPQRVDFRVVSSALPRRPKKRFLTPRKSIALDSLHLQLALDSLLASRSHCKQSLQGVIARSHCKESWQGVIARTHLQGLIAMSQLQGVIARSAWSQVARLLARSQVQVASARSQVQVAILAMTPCNDSLQ